MISAVGILYGLITLIAISHSSSSEDIVTPAPITPAPVTPSPTVDSPCDDCSSFNITADIFSSVAPSSTCPAINVDPSPSDSSDEAPDASEMICCGTDCASTISECLILGEDSSSDSGDATEPEKVLVDICIEYDIGGELDDLCFDNETVAIFLPLCNNTVLDVDDDGILAALDLLISSLTFEDGTNVAVAEGDVIDDVPGIVVELTANNVTGFELCLTNIILEVDEVDTIDIANYSMSMSMGSLLINDTFIIDCDFDGLPCFNFYIEGDCAGVLPDDSGDSSDSSSGSGSGSNIITLFAESESSASDSGSDSGSASASASASASGSGDSASGDSASGDSASGDSASGSSGAAGVASASADSGDSSGATATGGDSSGATATGGDSSDEGTTAVLSAGGDSSDAGTGTVAVASTGNAGSSSEVVVATPQPTVAGGTPSPTTAIVSGGSSDSDEVDPTPRPTPRPTTATVVTVPTTPAPTAATVSVIAASASDDNVRVRVRSRNRRRADSSEAVTVSSVTPSPVTVSVIAGGSSETRVRVRSRNRRNRGGDDSSDDDAKAIFGDADNEEYAVVNGGDGGKLEVNFSHWTLANIWAVMIGFGALNVFLYYCVGCGGKKGKKGIFARKYEKTDTEEPDMNDFGNGNDSDSA